jgi:hypothetical protein
MPNALYDHFKDFSSNSMTFAEKKQVWLEISDMTEDEFDRMMAEEKRPGIIGAAGRRRRPGFYRRTARRRPPPHRRVRYAVETEGSAGRARVRLVYLTAFPQSDRASE